MQIHRSHFKRFVACVLLPCQLLACKNWQTQEVSPEQVITEQQPDQIRVTLTDGTQRFLAEPRLSGDTLIGHDGDQSVSLPLVEVEHIAVLKTDARATTIVVILGVVGVVAAGTAIFFASIDQS